MPILCRRIARSTPGLILEENDPNSFARTDDWLLADFNPHKVAQTRANVYTRFTIRSLAQCLLAFADDQFTKETVESIPQARASLSRGIRSPQLAGDAGNVATGDKNLENSLLQALRNHAGMNLLKLRNGLNIAGLQTPTSVCNCSPNGHTPPDALSLSGLNRTGKATDRNGGTD